MTLAITITITITVTVTITITITITVTVTITITAGNTGVYFNDSSKMILHSDGNTFEHIPRCVCV
jgi:hypothetical protein